MNFILGKRGESVDVKLYGIPFQPLPKTSDADINPIKQIFAEEHQAYNFIQADPTKYLYVQREFTSKADIPTIQSEDIQVMTKIYIMLTFS